MTEEEEVRELQLTIARLEGEREAAQQATREIMKERNTWARELADMRGERDDARENLDNLRSLAAEQQGFDLARIVNLEGVIRDFLEEYEASCPDRWPGGINKMRGALEDD